MSLADQLDHYLFNCAVWYSIAGFSVAAAFIIDGYGDRLRKHRRNILKIAYTYHLCNSVALMTVPLGKRPWLTGSLIVGGVILFSGPCYYSAFTGDHRFVGLVPLGAAFTILALFA